MADKVLPQNNQATFLALEAKIKRAYSLIQETKEKLKEQREMFEAAFENDPVYREHDEKYQEARSVRLSIRQEILKDPAVAVVQERVGQIRLSLKELQDSLSQDLQQYQGLTGEKMIETDEGRLMEIVSKAKLVSRSS